MLRIGFLPVPGGDKTLYICRNCGKWKVEPHDEPRVHKCDNCGKRMHKASDDETMNLACPKCGTKNESGNMILWD